jgi:low temperature requirement protein LtrA
LFIERCKDCATLSESGGAPLKTEGQETRLVRSADPEPTGRDDQDLEERRVAPFELFFDLVFVFAITQVTGFLSDNLTWAGLARGLAVLAALWWAWVCYSWLTNNAVRAEEATPARLVVLAAMAAMLVASLAVPDAFGEAGIIFGGAYFLVRLLHLALYAFTTGDSLEARRAVVGFAPGFLGGPALLVIAGALSGSAQGALWAFALAIDYGVALLRGVAGFSVHAGHFAERHSLIIIIALGESIIAIGIGAAELELGVGVILAAILGIILAAGLWWAYFDHVALAAERRLIRAQGRERATLARDSYSYLHLPMVAGIVLVALGIKETLDHVGDPLGAVPAAALCGGVALYLLGHNAFRLRDTGSVSVPHLAATAVSLPLIPVAVRVPALITLATAAMLLVALAAYETSHSDGPRRKLRAH